VAGTLTVIIACLVRINKVIRPDEDMKPQWLWWLLLIAGAILQIVASILLNVAQVMRSYRRGAQR
jgi:hypothetical protein